MTGPFADRLFRIAFAAAGIYNLAFGLWAAVWPLSFFSVFEIPPPRYPGIWTCLGMVVGVYGFLYLYAACKLETAWPTIAVGLVGKVLGPIGMVASFGDDWPRRLGMICVYNDLIWWLPFGLFLVRGTAIGRWLVAMAPWVCVALHALAMSAMAVNLRPGSLAEVDVARRAGYIAEHVAAWSVGWALWMLAAMSLVGFYAWWGGELARSRPASQMPRRGAWSADSMSSRAIAATAGVLLAAIGMVFDLSGEGLSVLVLVERTAALVRVQSPALLDASAFTHLERTITLLTAVAANGLYTLGGIVLTLVTPELPRWVRAAMWITWLAGAAMTVAGVLDHVGGMVVATAVLFPTLVVWVAWMGARWRRA